MLLIATQEWRVQVDLCLCGSVIGPIERNHNEKKEMKRQFSQRHCVLNTTFLDVMPWPGITTQRLIFCGIYPFNKIVWNRFIHQHQLINSFLASRQNQLTGAELWKMSIKNRQIYFPHIPYFVRDFFRWKINGYGTSWWQIFIKITPKAFR